MERRTCFDPPSIIPGGAVVDGGGIGGAGHGAELLGILVLVDILRLIHFEQEVSGVAHDVGGFIGGEKHLAGGAQPDDIAELSLPDAVIAEIVEAVPEPVHADEGLGLEGGGAFDRGATFSDEHRQQEHFDMSGKLVLATLTGDFDGKGQAFPVQNAIENSPGNFQLIRA